MKTNKIYSLALASVLTLSLTGCAKEITTISDFSAFSDMTRETDKIEVSFDNHSGSPFNFTIEDDAQIDEIMEIIFTSTFKNLGSELFAGDNTTLRIIQGEREYNLHFAINKEGKNYYAFETDELQTGITELAREAGAYQSV